MAEDISEWGAGGGIRVAVLGVGLIGGSIGMAARRTGAHVAGYDPDATVLASAVALGAVDEPALDPADAVRDAEIVFVSAPVGAAVDIARLALQAASENCVVSDVGSTKRGIVAAVSDPRFVGGHPLAGAETAGVEHARADLFEDAAWYLTPPADAPSWTMQRLRALIEGLGARPVTIDAASHDLLMARMSHLPHVLANVLVAQALNAVESEELRLNDGELHAGPSFRDATRVAGANTAIWTDIYVSNSDLLADALDETIQRLSAVRDALDAEDPDGLAAWNDRARAARDRLARRGASGAGGKQTAGPTADS